MKKPVELSPVLRSLVKQTVAGLGEVIRQELGTAKYNRIEKIRSRMSRLRGVSYATSYRELSRVLGELKDLGDDERIEIAHAFALMLELMNACENAYRTHRLRTYPKAQLAREPEAIVYVLTAHPTEARSPETIAVFHEIQRALIQSLDGVDTRDRIQGLLTVAWRMALARGRKPSVKDEADSIFSIVLRNETLRALLAANRTLCPVYIRTWVGGDKDGHPGVGPAQMQRSLQQSRTNLLAWLELGLDKFKAFARKIDDPSLEKQLRQLSLTLRSLKTLGRGDGRRVARLRAQLKELEDLHPTVSDLRLLLKIFPGLVIPLELRESSEILVAASRGKPSAIARMIARVRVLSEGGDPKWYARGLIISMASSMEHIQAGCRVVIRELGALKIPVIPLFEQNDALERSSQIVQGMLSDAKIRQALHRYWDDYFEVMVGYSDSAKESGVLGSRVAIARSINELDLFYRKKQKSMRLRPVFFHGSGGSTDRGGGSIADQTAWWPESALSLYKATIQGETIERSLASPEITRRRLEQIAQMPSRKTHYRPSAALEAFADRVRHHYGTQVSDPEFLEVVQQATAYRYLSDLRMGSRPSKRGKMLSVQGLRAIPWVLCWTQTRVLFPTWWGVGSAWQELSATDRARLKREWRKDPLFRSYLQVLASTLARVELPVWQLYLENSGLDASVAKRVIREFRSEYELAVSWVRQMTGERDLMGYRPWLGTLIQLRSPMIHPLNLLQILTLKDRNPLLLRETVTGIASGMMTTG